MADETIKTAEECRQTLAARFSNLWNVQLNDFGRALVISAVAAPLGILYDWATIAGYTMTLVSILKGSVAGVAYLLKNFLTGSGGKLLTNK